MREYSIPSVKKAGRISIPEDSFEKIRHARDLHKEGLGTGAVRTRLSGAAPATDSGEIALKLDRLSRDLETLRGDPKALEEASSPHALRTILARQSLLMSAVFNLTEMVETLLRSTGQPRRPDFEDSGFGDTVEDGNEIREESAMAGIEGSGARLARSRPGRHEIRLSSPSAAIRSESRSERSERGFGSLARRRRRGGAVAAGLLAVLLILAILFFALSGTSSDTGGEAVPPADTRREIRVPDLSGLTYAEAETRLDEAGLVIEERDSREGEVVGQTPEPDTEAAEGDTVAVTLDADNEETTASPADSQYGNNEFEFTE